MIKLIDILEEIEVRSPMATSSEDGDEDIIKRGFRTTPLEVDPETGAIESTVEYLPKFEQIRRDLLKFRKEFQPFKYHPNEYISKNAKDLNTLLTKSSQMIFVLEKMIELERKTK